MREYGRKTRMEMDDFHSDKLKFRIKEVIRER